jgi:creatinine amidohydrolase
VTVRSSTLQNLLVDIGRSLIHHGFNRILFINGHGSNQKIIDPVIRSLKYETGALIGFISPIMERHVGVLDGLFGDIVTQTPGSHASDLEIAQMLFARPHLVHLERTNQHELHIPDFLPEAFAKKDGRPDVAFEGQNYFNFPMEYREISNNGATGAYNEASAEVGKEAFRRFATYISRGLHELQKKPVEITNREFIGRA